MLIEAAHNEDVRTWPSRRPAHAVAARVLHDLFRFPVRLVRVLGRLGRVSGDDPLEVARKFEADNQLPPVLVVPAAGSRSSGEIDATPAERRVFIGGNYARCFDRIYNAREVVVDGGYVPIIVREFEDVFGERERDKSFRILDACPKAVFEASEAGGWTSELDRLATSRPRTPTLMAYAADDPAKKHPSLMLPDTSDMPRLEKKAYLTAGDMRYHVLSWLSRLEPRDAPVATKQRFAVGSNTPAVPFDPPTVDATRSALPGTATPTSPQDVDVDDSPGRS
jgi:hypothetical protein